MTRFGRFLSIKERKRLIWGSLDHVVHKGDMKILSQMLKNIEASEGQVNFKAPLVVAPPTHIIL